MVEPYRVLQNSSIADCWVGSTRANYVTRNLYQIDDKSGLKIDLSIMSLQAGLSHVYKASLKEKRNIETSVRKDGLQLPRTWLWDIVPCSPTIRTFIYHYYFRCIFEQHNRWILAEFTNRVLISHKNNSSHKKIMSGTQWNRDKL